MLYLYKQLAPECTSLNYMDPFIEIDFETFSKMSVITTKSTMLSILKTPTSTPRSSLHRVRFELPSNIRKIFLEFKNGCNTRDYENLVCTIRDSEINDSNLLSLINEAKNCTSLLNYDLRLFVQALILVRWAHRSEAIVKAYQEFVSNLVSAHSCHTKLVIDQLVKLFLNVEESNFVDSQPNEFLLTQLNNIHLILQTTLTTIPMSESILIDSIKHNFPYSNAPTFKQASYVYNLFKIVQYQPDIRINILQIIVDKLVLLDVNCPKEEILQCTESPDEMLCGVDESEIEKANTAKMKHPIGETLDVLLDITFQYINRECYVDGKLNQVKCHRLYNDLMVIFETVILPIHACHHVQFIMFYFCSFETTLAQDFLKFLWRQVITPSVSPVIRQISAAYLSSFLARADFLSLGFLKNYLSKLSDWIHSYIAHHDSKTDFQADYKQHSVFYSICQAIFYLIAFRHPDLVNSAIKLKFLQSLNLPKVISCKLNPLKFCLPTIVENFAAVTRAYQLAYCYTVIENNARASIPVMGRGGQILLNSVVDVYFPFDPCALLRVSRYIIPLYKEYQAVLGQETTKLNDKKKRLYSGTEDEDDFIGEENLEEQISSDGIP